MFILSTNSNTDFSVEVAKHLNVKLVNCDIGRFANGEVRIKGIEKSMRGNTAYVIFSVGKNLNEDMVEAMILCDTIKGSSANKVVLVVPFYPYARQDKKTKGREPISAKWVAKVFEASGVDAIITVDLHNEAIQGFPNCPLDNLTAVPLFAETIIDSHIVPYIEKYGEDKKSDFIVVSPDAGGAERANKLANKLGLDMCMIYKHRDKPNEVASMELNGNVDGKIALIIDDMVDTCGTLKKAVVTLREKGAKEIYAFATHGPLSGKAIENIESAPLDKLYITNTMNLYDKIECKKIKVISISKLLAVAIVRHSMNKSLSKLFYLNKDQIDNELDRFIVSPIPENNEEERELLKAELKREILEELNMLPSIASTKH